jgi:hypothetical protein
MPREFFESAVGPRESAARGSGDEAKELSTVQAVVTRSETRELADAYLGFSIQWTEGKYIGRPKGWHGEAIEAESLPELRKKIWRFWHQV